MDSVENLPELTKADAQPPMNLVQSTHDMKAAAVCPPVYPRKCNIVMLHHGCVWMLRQGVLPPRN